MTPDQRQEKTPVGLVDRLGYIFCSDCATRLDKTGDPVWARSAPHNTDPCESCHRPLNHETTHQEQREAKGVTGCNAFTMGHRGCLVCGWQMFPPAPPVAKTRDELWREAVARAALKKES
jgi:hypothetical protein